MKNNTPKVSIVTTTLNLFKDNRQEFFRKCIESVHNQTYPNIEHIIIDRASTDDTLELIKEYQKKGWITYYSERDKGIDDAYNKGLKKATGKYIAYMNSDDCYYANDVIETSIKMMEEEQADYCYGSEEKVFRDGSLFMIWNPKVENFWKDMPFSHQTMIVKKSVMDELGGYNTDLGFGGDVYLVHQLILNDYKGIEIPRIISRYVMGGISSQTEDKKKVYQVYYVLAKRFQSLYSQFYPDITVEECENIYHFGKNINVYPSMFLQKLIHFMVRKNLKNFNYNKFIDFVNSIATGNSNTILSDKQIKKLYLFNFIPLMKIIKKAKSVKYKLFNCIPVLKIKG